VGSTPTASTSFFVRRFVTLLVLGAVLLGATAAAAQSAGVEFRYAGRMVTTPSLGTRIDVIPVLRLLGAEVGFSPAAGTWAVELGERNLQFSPGHHFVLADGELHEFSEAPAPSPQGGVLASVAFLEKGLLGPLGFHLESLEGGYRIVPGPRFGAPLLVRAAAADFGASTTLVLTLERQTPASVTQTADRIEIGLEDATPRLDHGIPLRSRRILSVEVGGPGLVVRLPSGVGLLSWHSLEDPPRVILELGERAPTPTPAPAVAPVARRSTVRPVVIDPGHGGDDTGAVSRDGIQEKDVTLAVARRLARILSSRGHAVRLTRTGDETRALTDRTALANRLEASVFVSLHANASRAASARGAETYYMSLDDASDDTAAAVARVENAAGGTRRSGSALDLILWDMAQAEVLNESARLALDIQQRLNSLLQLPDRGVKQAPFVVLTGATMPAALVEVGFLSNPGEARRLTEPGYQQRLAETLAAGIEDFLRSGS